jgi:hypothetical protein
MNERAHQFSPCRKYRYTLWREWHKDTLNLSADDEARTIHQFVQFIGLNPSTADEVQDDPTVRRCIQFAKDWGYGAMCMTNIFAFRATDPTNMKAEVSPVAELDLRHLQNENDTWLQRISRSAGLIICAWGRHGNHLKRHERVLDLLSDRKLHCLSVNADGTPAHPLYLPSILKPIPFPP